MTQRQIIETREFAKDALIVFSIIRVEATNKHQMVIVKEIDITTMSKLWMKELKNHKVVYPHTLIAFLTRIVWGNNSPIIELFYKTNTWSPDGVTLMGSPINLPHLFISKDFLRNILSLVHAELDENWKNFLLTPTFWNLFPMDLTNCLTYTSASYFVFNLSMCITIWNKVFINITL